jgi:hypothetical protein
VKRITLSKARLDVLSGIWERESQWVRELIYKLNGAEDSARDLDDQPANWPLISKPADARLPVSVRNWRQACKRWTRFDNAFLRI